LARSPLRRDQRRGQENAGEENQRASVRVEHVSMIQKPGHIGPETRDLLFERLQPTKGTKTTKVTNTKTPTLRPQNSQNSQRNVGNVEPCRVWSKAAANAAAFDPTTLAALRVLRVLRGKAFLEWK